MPRDIQQVQLFKARREKVKVGPLDVNYINRRPPWVPAWWSAALPGLGHIHLGHYLKGLLLMSGEIVLNYLSHLNLAIVYSMTGRFESVHDVINYNWLLLYCAIFVFAVWDSYRLTIEQNQASMIESMQVPRTIIHGTIHTWGMNSLTHRNPHMAFVWNFIFAGLFHVCNNKLISGITLMGWMIAISYFTDLPRMIMYTLLGQFALIPSLINIHWLLFFPSIYLFSVYDGYSHAVYYNELFSEEQASYFTEYFNESELKLD